mgnify:CR=1 FL=1
MGSLDVYLLDAIGVAAVVYLAMRYLFKLSMSKSLNRAVLVGALELSWLLLFGFTVFPTRLNPNL